MIDYLLAEFWIKTRTIYALVELVLSHAIYDIVMFFAHESHEFTRITMSCLFKATAQVAIKFIEKDS